MADETTDVFTIGHSTHSWERFVALLRSANVTAVADVRTAPYSRHYPHFNRDDLREELRSDGISYVFLGKELGGRPSERKFYCEGVADYEKMAQASEFSKGLDRVMEGAKKYRDCADVLRARPIGLSQMSTREPRPGAARRSREPHPGRWQRCEPHQIEERLLELSGRNTDDFFAPRSNDLQRRIANARARSRLLNHSPTPAARSRRSNNRVQGNRFDDWIHQDHRRRVF